jgi:GlcNAc-P-P-Und epimerase
MTMKVLVTGSSGFVGRALVRALRDRGHDVRGLSRTERADSLRADLLDRQSLEAAMHAFQPELVYHLAAQTDLKGRPVAGYPVNVAGVSHLLDAVEAEPVVRRVVWASSQLVNRPGRASSVDSEYDPADAYGASKAEGERLVRERDGGGREWVIFRSTTIWGPGMSDHYANILRMIRRGRYVHIGHRPLRKSYSYIDNLAAQLVTLGEAPGEQVHARTFYLADSEPIELREWHDRFAGAFGRRIPTIPLPAARLAAWAGDVLGYLGIRSPITSRRLSNMLTEYVHDVRDIEALHGKTRISNEEGVRRTVEWLEAAQGTGA